MILNKKMREMVKNVVDFITFSRKYVMFSEKMLNFTMILGKIYSLSTNGMI